MDELKKLYVDYGFPSTYKLFKIAQDNNLKISMKDIQEFINKERIRQLYFKEPTKSKGHIVAFSPNELWQMDLMDVSKYAHQNKNYKWILLIIDVFTRFSYGIAIKNKTNDEVYKGLKEILKDKKPKVIMTDNGKEFLGNKVENLLDEDDIIHQTNKVGEHTALGIIDRFVKTFRDMIGKNMTAHNNTNWIDNYKKLINSYNDTYHDTIKMKPKEGDKHILALSVLNNSLSKDNTQTKIKIGDIVRIKLKESKFKKSGLPLWSSNTYKVLEVNGLNAVLDDNKESKTYLLQKVDKEDKIDINKEELKSTKKKTQVRRLHKEELHEKAYEVEDEKEEEKYEIEKIIGDKKYHNKRFFLIKWKGYSNKHNTYEPENELIKDGNNKIIKEYLKIKK